MVVAIVQISMAVLMGARTMLRPSTQSGYQLKALRRGIRMWGPSTDQPVDTETLRNFKKVGTHVFGLESGHPILFRVEGRVGAINRYGLVLPGHLVEGAGPHVGARVQRLHLCRQHPCQSSEVGCLHITAYGALNPDDEIDVKTCWGQLTAGDPGASTVNVVMGWWAGSLRSVLSCLTCGLCSRRKATTPDPAPMSESENEEDHRGCEAGLVRWQDKRGVKMGLSMRGPCEESRSENATELLHDDLIGGGGGRAVAHLCWRHAAQYERERGRYRCPVVGCQRAGKYQLKGVHYCQVHAEEQDAEQRKQLPLNPLLPGGRFRIPTEGETMDDVQPATPPPLPQIVHAAVERDYLPDVSGDYPLSQPSTARSITSPIHTPRPSVSDLIRALPTAQPETSSMGDYDILHRYLETRAAGSLRGGRLSDEDTLRFLLQDPEVGKPDRRSLVTALVGGVQELSESEQSAMAPQCRTWMHELYPRGAVERGRDIDLSHTPEVSFAEAEPQSLSPLSATPNESGSASVDSQAHLGPRASILERGQMAYRSTSDRGVMPSMTRPPGLGSAPSNPGNLLQTIESALTQTSKGTSATVQTLQHGRRTGAPPGELGARVGTGMQLNEDSLRHMGELARMQLEEKRGERGSLKGIGREDEDMVLLLRCCNRFVVQVCPDTTGRALYKALKNASVGAGGHMRQVGWPVPMKNRIALGISSCLWGGRSH
eukprot:3116614-Amphidinium_carterae.1